MTFRVHESPPRDAVASPTEVEMWFANLILRQYDATIKDIETALAINDQLADSYLMQGFAYCNQRDYAAAEAAYSRGLELDPTFMLLHLLRAEVRLEQDDWNAAFEDVGVVQESNLADAFAEYIDAAISGDLSCENFFRYEP